MEREREREREREIKKRVGEEIERGERWGREGSREGKRTRDRTMGLGREEMCDGTGKREKIWCYKIGRISFDLETVGYLIAGYQILCTLLFYFFTWAREWKRWGLGAEGSGR